MSSGIIGWDIGGVNTKAAAVDSAGVRAVRERPFALQQDASALPALLRTLAADVGAPAHVEHAVTMTAELSQLFRTKREGVCFVVDAVETAFPGTRVRIFTVGGAFVAADEARANPLAVAAANWMATALLVARHHRDAILIDIGTTTTDIIPIVDGTVAAAGRTDCDRLATGELRYTGAVRTPVEAIVRDVDVRGRRVAVSAEGFAVSGDVHLWRGDLPEHDYDAATPDGRPASRPFAGERLRRVVCADRDMLSDDDVSSIAHDVAQAQIDQIAAAIACVRTAHPGLRKAVVAGRGAFLATAAARRSGLAVEPLSVQLGSAAAFSAPAVAVALLAAAAGQTAATVTVQVSVEEPLVDVVVKVGGGTLASPADLEAVCAALEGWAPARVLVVPGGGPFADAVREIDRRHRLADDVAHWMAVRAMDVFAEQLASRFVRGELVALPDAVRAAVRRGRLPILAPYQWVRRNDALPHSWSVTSDSIAAWLAGEAGASQVILIKPRGAQGPVLTDPYFRAALPPGVRATVVPVEDLLFQGFPPQVP